jgi:hypothetical protein
LTGVFRLVALRRHGRLKKNTVGWRDTFRTGHVQGGLQLPDAKGIAPVLPGESLQDNTRAFWPNVWWSIVDYKIGIIPLPIYLILFAVIAGFALTGKVPSDILMSIVLLSMAASPAPNWASAFRSFATSERRRYSPPSSRLFSHSITFCRPPSWIR